MLNNNNNKNIAIKIIKIIMWWWDEYIDNAWKWQSDNLWSNHCALSYVLVSSVNVVSSTLPLHLLLLKWT
jgi:hypothetical protein